jgi:hypothetical protein
MSCIINEQANLSSLLELSLQLSIVICSGADKSLEQLTRGEVVIKNKNVLKLINILLFFNSVCLSMKVQ